MLMFVCLFLFVYHSRTFDGVRSFHNGTDFELFEKTQCSESRLDGRKPVVFPKLPHHCGLVCSSQRDGSTAYPRKNYVSACTEDSDIIQQEQCTSGRLGGVDNDKKLLSVDLDQESTSIIQIKANDGTWVNASRCSTSPCFLQYRNSTTGWQALRQHKCFSFVTANRVATVSLDMQDCTSSEKNRYKGLMFRLQLNCHVDNDRDYDTCILFKTIGTFIVADAEHLVSTSCQASSTVFTLRPSSMETTSTETSRSTPGLVYSSLARTTQSIISIYNNTVAPLYATHVLTRKSVNILKSAAVSSLNFANSSFPIFSVLPPNTTPDDFVVMYVPIIITGAIVFLIILLFICITCRNRRRRRTRYRFKDMELNGTVRHFSSFAAADLISSNQKNMTSLQKLPSFRRNYPDFLLNNGYIPEEAPYEEIRDVIPNGNVVNKESDNGDDDDDMNSENETLIDFSSDETNQEDSDIDDRSSTDNVSDEDTSTFSHDDTTYSKQDQVRLRYFIQKWKSKVKPPSLGDPNLTLDLGNPMNKISSTNEGNHIVLFETPNDDTLHLYKNPDRCKPTTSYTDVFNNDSENEDSAISSNSDKESNESESNSSATGQSFMEFPPALPAKQSKENSISSDEGIYMHPRFPPLAAFASCDKEVNTYFITPTIRGDRRYSVTENYRKQVHEDVSITRLSYSQFNYGDRDHREGNSSCNGFCLLLADYFIHQFSSQKKLIAKIPYLLAKAETIWNEATIGSTTVEEAYTLLLNRLGYEEFNLKYGDETFWSIDQGIGGENAVEALREIYGTCLTSEERQCILVTFYPDKSCLCLFDNNGRQYFVDAHIHFKDNNQDRVAALADVDCGGVVCSSKNADAMLDFIVNNMCLEMKAEPKIGTAIPLLQSVGTHAVDYI